MICPHCSSADTINRGFNKSGTKRLNCKTCNKWFTAPLKEKFAKEIYYGDIEPGQVLNLEYKKAKNIHCATDVHHGANEHHTEKFDELIEEVYSDPAARWFLN